MNFTALTEQEVKAFSICNQNVFTILDIYLNKETKQVSIETVSEKIVVGGIRTRAFYYIKDFFLS